MVSAEVRLAARVRVRSTRYVVGRTVVEAAVQSNGEDEHELPAASVAKVKTWVSTSRCRVCDVLGTRYP